MNVFGRDKLDKMDCAVPTCEHKDHRLIFMHARCHISSGVEVEYDRIDGALTIRCQKCKRFIMRIAVASESR